MTNEQTLVLIKPDGVQRNLAGEILSRFESAGLKINAMKMIQASDKLAEAHYPLDEEWALSVYNKTKAVYEKLGKEFGYKDHIEHGKTIQSWLINFLKEGPVIAMVLEGPNSIELVRKMVGATEPKQASSGTIRGDFASTESYTTADKEKRALRNLIHASDSIENAQKEIALWFSKEEIH